jgi:hypothetical protein
MPIAYPHAATEYEVATCEHVYDENDRPLTRVNKVTYRVTGRGPRNREVANIETGLSLTHDDVAILVGELIGELAKEKQDAVGVVGGPTTIAITVSDMESMTRAMAARLIGQLAVALV